MDIKQMILKLRTRFDEQSIAMAVGLKTNYRTTILEELTDDEIIHFYHLYFPKPKTPAMIAQELAMEKEVKRLRSIILKEASAIGLLAPDDWTKFNAFMLKYSPLKKALNEYKINEFTELIKQFKSLRSKYEKDAKMPHTRAWYHKHKITPPSKN